MSKPIPKSLHTVTVLVALAKFCHAVAVFGDDRKPRAVDYAMNLLGLAGRPDPYGLAGAALKQLQKED